MPGPAIELELARLADLHPTQITVGFREVAHKQLRLRSQRRKALAEGAPGLVAPIVLGPQGRPYLVDRHHLACAMIKEGLRDVHVVRIADLSALGLDDFWAALEARGWCRPYDADGRRRPFSAIPSSLEDLAEDPLRSLAGALRRAGGFRKTQAPFSEFAWADFLRERLSIEAVRDDFGGCLDRALALARTTEASHLPGWRARRAPGGRVGAVAASHACV